MIPQYYKKRFTLEKAGADRKCREGGCLNIIKKGTYCMSVNQLIEVPISYKKYGQSSRIAYKKLSYCPKCANLKIQKLIEGLNNERDHFETLMGRLKPLTKRKYRGIVLGDD